jgi:hypothetical protein
VAGRFPLLTDENVSGPIVAALIHQGWDILRAVDTHGERSDDAVLFVYAANNGRVFVSSDEPARAIAIQWIEQGRPFRGMVCWIQEHQRRMTVGDFLREFEALASEEDPFILGIRYIKPRP